MKMGIKTTNSIIKEAEEFFNSNLKKSIEQDKYEILAKATKICKDWIFLCYMQGGLDQDSWETLIDIINSATEEMKRIKLPRRKA